MRILVAIALALSLGACDALNAAGGAGSRPSPALENLRAQFEREILAMEGNYSDGDELRAAALPVAQRAYGANWGVVRAEALRTLAALPEIDLSPYAAMTPERPQIDLQQAGLNEMLSPAGLAAWRAYDADMVAFSVASMSVRPFDDGDSFSMIGAKFTLVGSRAYRGGFAGRDVLAVRFYRSMVIIPYTLTAEGLIRPSFEEVAIYRLQGASGDASANEPAGRREPQFDESSAEAPAAEPAWEASPSDPAAAAERH